MPETNLTIGATLPGEALAIRILDFIESRRAGMDTELLKRYDIVGLEFVEWWHSRFKQFAELMDKQPPKP